MARAVSVLPSANGLLRAAEVGDGAEGSSGEGRRRGRRLEDRGSAGDVVPAGRRRNDQARGVASDAPDRESVTDPSGATRPQDDGRGRQLTALLTARGATKKKPH